MSEHKNKLQELFERKESITSKMDSFQIVEEIEHITIDLLNSIFKPYSLKEVPRRNLTHIPDGMLRFTPLGKIKNRVFFEIKARKMAYYDLKTIREMMQELKSIYAHRFHSLVFISRTFDKKIVARMILERENYTGKIAFLSVGTLVDLYQTLITDPKFERPEYKELFLANLLQSEGVLSSKVIADARTYTKIFEEYKFEGISVETLTRDKSSLSLVMSLNVEVEDERLFKQIEEVDMPISDNVKKLFLRTIENSVQQRPLLEFSFEAERTLSSLRGDLSHELKKHGLKLSDFRCNWEFDQYARGKIEESRQFIDKSKFLREEIDAFDRQLTKALTHWKRRINNFYSALESLDLEYMRGDITKDVYLKRIDEIAHNITVLKEELNKSLPNAAKVKDSL